MGRRAEGIRAWYDEKAKKWHIRDSDPKAPRKKWSLGFGKEEPNSALRAFKLAEQYKAEKEAGSRLNITHRSSDEMSVADVIAIYTDRRINNFVPSTHYPHPLTRVDDVKIRLRVLLAFFQDLPLSSLTVVRCEDFGKFVHRREIERARKLYDRQVEIYNDKLDAYEKKVAEREKFIAKLVERKRTRILPALRSKPPEELPPFNSTLIPYRRSASRRYLEELSAAITFTRRSGLLRQKVDVPLPPKYDKRSATLSMFEVRKLLRNCKQTRGMGWIDGRPVKNLPVRQHLGRFIFLALTTGSRKDKVERASFRNEADRPWIELYQKRNSQGVLEWKGRYHRLGTDEVEHKNKKAPPVPIPSPVVRRLLVWKQEGIIYPCAHPYAASGREEPGNVKDGIRRLFDEVLGMDNDAVIHTLRHTAATWLSAQEEFPLAAVAAYLGMTLETLVKTYAHAREKDVQMVADNMFKSRRERYPEKLSETNPKRTENGRQISTETDRMEMKRSA
jgi:integrase